MSIKEKIANLLGRREIIAFALVGTFCYGFIAGKISTEIFAPVVTAVIAFYFGTRKAE